MASALSLITSNVVDRLETPPWILLAVCAVGVFLAYITDEGYSLITSGSTDAGRKAATKPDKKTKTSMTDGMISWGTRIGSSTIDMLPAPIKSYLEPLTRTLSGYISKFQLYRESMALKKFATTKRHFFYLIEKQTLKLPIVPGETEIDSYLDCKRHLGPTWPFMWEVANVRDKKVQCNGSDCIPMSSYSYLDLLRDERVQGAAIEAAQAWATGNHGPRMLGGNMTILRDLEKRIAKFFGRDDTLLCAAGFLACMSACAAISSENTVIFGDSRLHASLRSGFKQGDAKMVWFKHNDFSDCERLIKRERSKHKDAWMVIESVYSMDGDICNLPAAHALCKQYDIKMIIDEAHGLGVVGATGRGVEEHFGLKGCATLIVGTFSKSIASIGGYITGPQRYIDYLDFHAPGNVFSAPLPAYCAGAAIKSFDIIDAEPQIVKKAQQNSKKLRSLLENGAGCWPTDYPENYKYKVEGDEVSTVLPVVFPDDIDRVMRIASRLKERGYMCSAVAYPACPLRGPRFRITATSAYTDDMMEDFVKTFVKICLEEAPSEFTKTIHG